MKNFFLLLLVAFVTSVNVFGQQVNKDLQALAETEKSFARFAAEKDTKSAFLEFAAPDGIMFAPNAVNARQLWNSRGESKGLLSWQPSFVDISANGLLGWTTGPWAFYPQGKTEPAAGFGEFVTLWQRQPDGKFRFVLDIGISHSQTQVDGVEWKSPADTGTETNAKNISAADSANSFFETANQSGLSKAYKTFVADDVRLLREGKTPVLGKTDVLAAFKKDKSSVAFAKRSVFFGAADLAYITNSYTLTREDKTIEKGNFVQIWKLRGGKWQIVLDIFHPTPEKQ